MINKVYLLPFAALALVAAKPQPAPAPASVTPPAAIAADPANKLHLQLSTGGEIVLQLRPDVAPNHVARIQQLVGQGFYNGLKFHRVIPDFMAQTGDPKGTGEGGSPLPDLTAEFNSLPHMRGMLAMARKADNVNSANSQFFIMLSPTFGLDKKYTVFGRVISGMAAVDGIAPGEPPAAPTTITRAWLEGAAPAPVPAAEAAPAEQPKPAEAAAPAQ